MYTVIETPTFAADAQEIWTEEERVAFCAWLALNPDAGQVIPDSGYCRKVRWSGAGLEKPSKARVIIFKRVGYSELWLLVIYAKHVQGSIAAHILKAVSGGIADVD